MMTRKDYQLLADTLKASRPPKPGDRSFTNQAEDTWFDITAAITVALIGDNPRFDAQKFTDATIGDV